MSQGKSNKSFLEVIDDPTKKEILKNISIQYGISEAEAFDEVTDDEAESLLDYLVEPCRSATSVLMRRHAVR